MRHGTTIDSVAFLPDGKTLVSGTGDATVRFWDVATGKQTSVVPTHANSGGTRFAVSPDGKTIAVTSTRLVNIELYDVATAKRIAVIDHAHNANIKALAFFPDGRRQMMPPALCSPLRVPPSLH
jgi:WD40 repeat protein